MSISIGPAARGGRGRLESFVDAPEGDARELVPQQAAWQIRVIDRHRRGVIDRHRRGVIDRHRRGVIDRHRRGVIDRHRR
ncbi:hypothetical protein, partial [Nocardia sp. NPDC004123]